MKQIMLRVEDDLYKQIRELAIYTNNSTCGTIENILLQIIPERHKFIKPDRLAEIRKKLWEKK